MHYVVEILPASRWQREEAVDRVSLAFEDRQRRRYRFEGEKGLSFLLDSSGVVHLTDGDGLRLEDGRIVRVEAAAEDLVEVRAASAGDLARLAWHIGNRHMPAQIDGGRILLRNDHVIIAMLEGLGAEVRPITSPFTPEGGAYDGGHLHHGHGPDGGDGHADGPLAEHPDEHTPHHS